MKKKYIIILIIVLVVLVALVIGALTIGKDLTQKNNLISEMAKVTSMDISKDSVDMTIKSEGDYAVVEQTAKEYYDEYIKTVQDILNTIQDRQLSSLLTVDNYKEDAPEFKKSLEYIGNTKKSLEEKFAKLEELSKKENIEARIQDKNLEEKYIKLYNEIIVADATNVEFAAAIQELNEASEKANELLDVAEKVLKFLAENDKRWEVDESGKVLFKTDKLAEDYNTLIQPLVQ